MVQQTASEVARAEAARGASEARYRQIFERSTSVTWVLDPASMRIVDANPAAVMFYGWPREELIGKPLAEITVLPEWSVRAMIEAAEGERRNFFVSRHRLRSGEERDVEVHSSPIELDGRRALFSIVHDITDRVRAERRLVESEANYRRALEQASDAIVVSDRQGSILEVNARTEEILGFGRGEMIGRGLEEFLPSEDRERKPLRLRELLDGESVLSERRLPRKDGTLVNVEISARDLGDGRFQAIVRDISERRRLEEQLRQAQKMEAVGQLTGGIAHDLNNLLTVVLANSEMMASDLPPGREDIKSELGELQAAACRGAQMIRKLLSFSRHAPLTYQVLDLGRVVEDLLGTLRRLLPAHIEVAFARESEGIKVLAGRGRHRAGPARRRDPERGTPRGVLRLEIGRVSPRPQTPRCPAGTDASRCGTTHRLEECGRGPSAFFPASRGEGSGLGIAMIYGSRSSRASSGRKRSRRSATIQPTSARAGRSP
jgi:PAS domain S-box-containing protein